MNNIEERIESLKANVELSKMVTLDELTVSVSDLDALIAQLESAQKERDALREVHIGAGSNTRAAADIYFQLVEELEVPAGGSLVGVIDNLKAELSAANAKPKPISFDELADRVQFVTGGIRMSFDPLNCKGHQIVPFMNFNSLLRIVEMYRTTETYHLAGGKVEEDATPIVIVPAPAGVIMRPQFEKPLERCAAGRDGECSHQDCPQLRDNEPMATGRHCPIDDWDD
ncbi:TPA: hypothetical protein RNH74_002393 [Yersinia enterocolitica]|uniref:hypothetical protein n=1 Tax=Yersinia enterocolitica TaxID=630 RepID=UPI00287B081D|nr:hypothetical protein [Yersinia enterocolitica]HDL8301808.1 hypothetical protein [Yersinia enterocolitica]HDW9412415.1 hypothetical protein [Yersinia enterocolitica]